MENIVDKAFIKKTLIESVIILGIFTTLTLFVLSIFKVENDTMGKVKHNNAFIIRTEEKKPEMIIPPGFYANMTKMRSNAKAYRENKSYG